MSVLGRAVSGSVEQVAATFNTNVTSSDNGKVVYFNQVSQEFDLLSGIDVDTITNNLVGVISVVTIDGDTIGGLGQGFVTIKGTVQKAGAQPGQAFFVGITADMVDVPPIDNPTIRLGYSKQAGFVYVDVDPNTIQIAVLSDRLTALEQTVQEIADQVLDAPVYDFGANDNWAVNIEDTNTEFGLDDNWTEGTVEYNADFGDDDNWAVLTII